jgi:hypothetical protein
MIRIDIAEGVTIASRSSITAMASPVTESARCTEDAEASRMAAAIRTLAGAVVNPRRAVRSSDPTEGQAICDGMKVQASPRPQLNEGLLGERFSSVMRVPLLWSQ